ncbi:transcription factor [Salix suchowensis]|nr:transcription factor [Salix suchowensis]
MLDAWDDYTFNTSDGHHLHTTTTSNPVKVEPTDPLPWNWEPVPWGEDSIAASSPVFSPAIKEEDHDFENLLVNYSPLSSEGSSISDSLHILSDHCGGRGDASYVITSAPVSCTAGSTARGALASFPNDAQSPTLATLASLIQSMSMSSPTAVSPAALRISSSATGAPSIGSSLELAPPPDIVVVHTCQPCTPIVSATQIEGISVYQTVIGSRRLLRRIDTDFVNILPVAVYIGSSIPSTSAAVQVTKGSAAVLGTWVPLLVAQSYLQSCLASTSNLSSTERTTLQGLLDIFLSDVLFERFPTALQDFHRSSTPGRLLQQFGPHFQSTMVSSIAEQQQGWDVLHHHTCEAVTLAPSLSWAPRGSRDFYPADQVVEDTQLSPSEQEIFQAICANPDWEQDAPPVEVELARVLEREEAIPEPKYTTELVAQPPCQITKSVPIEHGFEEVPQQAAHVPLLIKSPLLRKSWQRIPINPFGAQSESQTLFPLKLRPDHGGVLPRHCPKLIPLLMD